MGINNRQRRAAKARQRRHQHRTQGRTQGRAGGNAGWAPGASGLLPPTIEELLLAAAEADLLGVDQIRTVSVELLLERPPRHVAAVAGAQLERRLAAAWHFGWQPADIARVAARRLEATGRDIVTAAMASQARSYAAIGATAAPAWMAQLDEAGACPHQADDTGAVLLRGENWVDTLLAGIGALSLLLSLPQLPCLVDPPERWRSGTVVDDGSLPPAMLERIRALLAKAESTTFEAEADALTAKAQELMARHRIDQALLDASRAASGGPTARPVGRRLGVDDPYAEAKAALLAGIASANGGHAVWSKGLGFSTVFAHRGELDSIEALFTSLLVQATAALRREGSRSDRWGRSRTTRFRRSFLAAFAQRITERLHEAAAAAVEQAEAESEAEARRARSEAGAEASETAPSAGALVPLLQARDQASRDAAEEAFPEMTFFSPSASDREGWAAGRLFGDRADLGLGPGLQEGARRAG